MPNLETAFSIWQQDASCFDSARLPDVQIPLMALVGVYACVPEVVKNVYAFRNAVASDDQLCSSLSSVIPNDLRYEFEDDETFPVGIVRAGKTAHLRAQQEDAMLTDGLPKTETTITSREYFLTRFLGQAAHNYAIKLQPLRLDMTIAVVPLRDYFPKSLALMEVYT
ncbi:hypothetical protein H7Y63_04155 [Polaromonas sp.]|nr:hypothetical protein [Candidatus Saccharibacteria bacterium]